MGQQKIDALIKRAYDGRGSDIQSSISLTKQALQGSIDMQYLDGIAKAENQLSLFHLIQGEFDKARDFANSALRYFTEHNNQKGIADSKYNLGSILYRTDDYHQGLLLLLDCLSAYRELDDFHNQARVLKSMGTIYEYFEDYDNASASYLQCIEISKQIKDLDLESNAYNPLSGIYLKRQEYDKAFELIQKSISIKSITHDNRGMAFALYARGKVYLRKKEFEKSIDDFNGSLALTLKASDKLGQGMVYNKIGAAYLELGDFKLARHNFMQAEAVSTQFSISFILFKTYQHLYDLAKAEQKPVEALEYLEKSIVLKETVINKKTYNIIKSYDAILKIEALEHESRLQKEKNIIVEKKNAELDSFFYRVSHDLKGPISSLLGLYNLVQMEIKDQSALKYFDLFHDQSMRMNNIVMGLINLTEIKNTAKLKTKIDFEKLVDECVNSCHYLDQSAVIKIKKEIEPIDFYSEWAIINTILQNLIENAIKYSRKNNEPFVNISIRIDENYIVIKVEDNGQGISQDHQSNVFDMFYRANDNTKGSGLGLYILKRAVERLNGIVKLQSAPNEGSMFTVTLPLN